jgi:hypothetical protein
MNDTNRSTRRTSIALYYRILNGDNGLIVPLCVIFQNTPVYYFHCLFQLALKYIEREDKSSVTYCM